jgi:hypothetical protein
MTDAPAAIQEDITYCAVHTEKEASLRCIRCNRYMCTQCVVQTPVGYICRQCAKQHDDKFFDATQLDDVIVFAACAVLTGIGAAIVNAMNIPAFFMLILGLPIGGLIAEAALRLTKKRRGRNSHLIALAACVIGGFSGALLHEYLRLSDLINAETLRLYAEALGTSATTIPQLALEGIIADFSVLLFIGVAAAAVYGRYRSRV